jgi:tetratricopeptide (TPR) repeat protein
LMTVTAYYPCLGYAFTSFDDRDYVTENAHVQAGLTAGSIRWAFTTFDCGNWHPLTWLSLQLDWTLYGSGAGSFHPSKVQMAGGFHLTNLLLHTASALLLFLTLGRMTGLIWRSAMVASLFALHPLNVESVAWVAERKGVLSTFFWMLTLAAYLHYLERPRWRRYLLVLLSLVLGLMAKPMLVTLPAVLVLLDYWPLQRLGDRSVSEADPRQGRPSLTLPASMLEKLPLFVVVLAWCVIAYLTQLRIGALPSLEKYPPGVRVANALLACVAYLGKMIGPVNLSAYYPHPGAAVSLVQAALAGLFLSVITALVLGPGRCWRYLAVGWLWYLVTLLPMIGLVQVGAHGMADRYSYVPLIGLFVSLTWGLGDLAAAWRLPGFCLVAASALVLATCFLLTQAQVQYWKSDRALWEHALAATGRNAMAHNNLGTYFKRQGMNPRAEWEFAQAVKIEPGQALFHHNLAALLGDRGRAAEAIAECRQAIELDAGQAVFHFTLGNLLRNQGQEQEALQELQEAARLDPESPLTHGNLANALLDLDRPEQASREYHKAIELDPQYESPHLGLGKLWAEEERFEDAAAEFRRAADLAPGSAIAHLNLAMALQELGKLEEALDQYNEAQRLGLREADPGLRACGRLQALAARLPALLAGRDRPASNTERLGFAHLCSQLFEARYALAAHLYQEAFRNDPTWIDDLHAVDRSDAAIAAARAGCGQGKDADGLDDTERTRLRQQARTWLEAELALWAQRARSGQPGAAGVVRQTLRNWQRSRGLAAVREPAAVPKLPPAERQDWQKLWQAVAAERLQATGQASR